MKNNKILIAAFAALVLAACSPTIIDRGNMLADYQIKSVTAGVSTRSDVLRSLGSPTTTSPFDENTWYYIGQTVEKKGILDPKITKERIVEVQFAQDGTLQSLRELPPGSDIDVPIARAKTPTYGNEVTIMQQLLGNVGRFNKQPGEGDTGGGARTGRQ